MIKPHWRRLARKLLRYLKYFAVSSLLLILIEIGVGYWLISSRWNIFLTDDQMKILAKEVNAASQLPPNFVTVYQKMYPNVIHTSMTRQLFMNYGSRILLKKRQFDDLPDCACDLVYDVQTQYNSMLAGIQWPGRLQELEYGFAMEAYSTPENCFNYVTNDRIQFLRRINLPSPFGELVQKDINAMSEDDLIRFILVIKSDLKPSWLNDQQNIDASVDYFKNKLHQ